MLIGILLLPLPIKQIYHCIVGQIHKASPVPLCSCRVTKHTSVTDVKVHTCYANCVPAGRSANLIKSVFMIHLDFSVWASTTDPGKWSQL